VDEPVEFSGAIEIDDPSAKPSSLTITDSVASSGSSASQFIRDSGVTITGHYFDSGGAPLSEPEGDAVETPADEAAGPEEQPQTDSGDSGGLDVPDGAADVVEWVLAVADYTVERAQAARDAEMERPPSTRRKSVLATVNRALGLDQRDGLPS
jgi:hypothetical protein